jgi:isopenicillin N synthase-like dioxygenase
VAPGLNIINIVYILTNSTYKSVEHRVVYAERGRMTTIIVQDAFVDGLVTLLSELLLKGDEAPWYKSIPRFEVTLAHKRFLETPPFSPEAVKLARRL